MQGETKWKSLCSQSYVNNGNIENETGGACQEWKICITGITIWKE